MVGLLLQNWYSQLIFISVLHCNIPSIPMIDSSTCLEQRFLGVVMINQKSKFTLSELSGECCWVGLQTSFDSSIFGA